MTRLDCSVVKCIYNADNQCGKGDIMVDGKTAVTSRDTCCSSFKEKKEGCGCNSAGHPKDNIKVDCKATNCIYNKDCECSANHIGIAGREACVCTDTECASFNCK